MASVEADGGHEERAWQRGRIWPLCFLAGVLLSSTLLESALDTPLESALDTPLESALDTPLESALDRPPEPTIDESTDFDRMTVRELRQLPGLGEARALAIVRARWQQGLLGGPRALEPLPGIGPATIEGLEAWLESRRDGASDLVPRAPERKLTRDDSRTAGPSEESSDSSPTVGAHPASESSPR